MMVGVLWFGGVLLLLGHHKVNYGLYFILNNVRWPSVAYYKLIPLLYKKKRKDAELSLLFKNMHSVQADR